MGDHRLDIESCLEETGQAIPGFEEPATCHPIYADAFENNFVGQVKTYGAGWNTKKSDATSVFHGIESLV